MLRPGLVIAVVMMPLQVLRAELPSEVEIRKDVLDDKIQGGLLGQILGNLNGLPHEMKYIDEPGAVERYTPALPEGARTDDDTDIEWIYVVEMQRGGVILLPDERIVDLWKRHINRKIWCANRYARNLMDIGIAPPLTGRIAINPWSDFNISGQFICESFALIAPGMPQSAAKIGLHHTHVSIDGEPAQTTQLFTAMIATAFIEADLQKILDAGLAAVDPHSEIHRVVTDVIVWWREHPDDWKTTRRLIKERYTHHGGATRDRNGYELNTACTIAALLYGRGDFVETLRTAFNLGWDADNNAATSGSIIGIIRGRHWMDAQGWNIVDRYSNTTRDDMPMDETITRFGDRLADLAARVILENAGRTIRIDGRPGYRIRTQKPANVEPLPKPLNRQPGLQKELTPLVLVGLHGSSVQRARSAYLALCFGQADQLATDHPEAWKQALLALQGYPDLVREIFRAPAPSATGLQTRALAAGLKQPAK